MHTLSIIKNTYKFIINAKHLCEYNIIMLMVCVIPLFRKILPSSTSVINF